MAILLEHNLSGTIVECPQDWNIARKEILGTCIGSSHFAQILYWIAYTMGYITSKVPGVWKISFQLDSNEMVVNPLFWGKLIIQPLCTNYMQQPCWLTSDSYVR